MKVIGFTLRQADLPAAPWPQTGDGPEQQRLSGARVAGHQDTVARPNLHMRIGKPRAALRRGDLEIVEAHAAGLGFGERIRFSTSCRSSTLSMAERKDATRSNVARQSAMPPILSTNQRSDGMDLREGGRRHHQSAETQIAGEIDRRSDHDRRDHGDPAVARRHPVEPHHGLDDAPARQQHRRKVEFQRRLSSASPPASEIASMCSLTYISEKRSSASRA